jgi:xeroderma pigmentosum group C-complementing protein
MPPKLRSRGGGQVGNAEGSGPAGNRLVIESGREANPRGRGKAITPNRENGHYGRSRAKQGTKTSSAVPEIFQDMLAETLSSPQINEGERPRKRRRVARPEDLRTSGNHGSEIDEHEGHDDESVEFEDVVPSLRQQTSYNDSESSSESDIAWQEVDAPNISQRSSVARDDDGDLDLTLVAENTPRQKSTAPRRKVANKAERAIRLDVHKMHLLCLLSFIDRRNNWCNDSEVQGTLKKLLTKQMIDCLKPKESYTQFGKAESVKKGLALICQMWESKFNITAKGMQRTYWAENEREIQAVWPE